MPIASMNFWRYSGVSTTRFTSAAILSMTGFGVPAGAATMNHERASKGRPASANVGTSGSTG